MKEALKLALEALTWSTPHENAVITHKEAITAIKAALAQPPQRTWVGLTDEQRDAITDKVIGFNSCCGWEDNYAKTIEAKLKENNT